jgi:hypothetical protein
MLTTELTKAQHVALSKRLRRTRSVASEIMKTRFSFDEWPDLESARTPGHAFRPWLVSVLFPCLGALRRFVVRVMLHRRVTQRELAMIVWLRSS